MRMAYGQTQISICGLLWYKMHQDVPECVLYPNHVPEKTVTVQEEGM